MSQLKPILWINGQKQSGKTTLAHGVKSALPGAIVIDEQDVKDVFADSSIEQQLLIAQGFATLLQSGGHTVVVAFGAPGAMLRDGIKSKTKVVEIYCLPGHDEIVGGVKPPVEEMLGVDTRAKSIEVCVAEILAHYKKA